MGFFGALGRIIQGKPVFEVPQDPAPPQPAAPDMPGGDGRPQTQSQNPVAAGPKVFPRVYIERTECHMTNNGMDLDFFIQNDSQGQVDVDRLEVMGRSQDLGTFLRPGEERKFRVYSGPRPTSAAMSRVTLDFKDQASDMFRAEHTLEFKQEADNTYTIDRIRFLRVDDV